MFLSPRNSNLHVPVHTKFWIFTFRSTKIRIFMFRSPTNSSSTFRSEIFLNLHVPGPNKGPADGCWLESVLYEGVGETLVECDPLGRVQHVDLLQKISQLGNLNTTKKDKNDANKKGIKDIKWAGITKTRDFNNQKGTTYDPAPGSWHWMFKYRVIIKFWFVICQGELHKKFYLLLLYKWKIGSAKSDNLFLLKCFLYQLFSQIIIKYQISNKINVFFYIF